MNLNKTLGRIALAAILSANLATVARGCFQYASLGKYETVCTPDDPSPYGDLQEYVPPQPGECADSIDPLKGCNEHDAQQTEREVLTIDDKTCDTSKGIYSTLVPWHNTIYGGFDSNTTCTL